MNATQLTTRIREKRVEAMITDLQALIPDDRREYIESLTRSEHKRVETMIDDFLKLDPDDRGKYIDTLTDLLCNRQDVYAGGQSGCPAEKYASDGQPHARVVL